PQGRANDLDGVSCTSPGTCAVVGADDIGLCSTEKSDYEVPVIGFLRDGRWSLHRTPNESCSSSSRGGSELNAVSCTSINACTAVGDTAYRWNGRRWTKQRTSPGGEGVSCSSDVLCTAVGNGTTTRWSGVRWSAERTPRTHGGGLAAVWCNAAGWCVAVGS